MDDHSLNAEDLKREIKSRANGFFSDDLLVTITEEPENHSVRITGSARSPYAGQLATAAALNAINGSGFTLQNELKIPKRSS